MELSFLDFLQTLHSPVLDAVMVFITTLGDHGFIWIAFALIFLMSKKYRKLGLCLGLALIIDLIAVDLVIKPLVQRIRPYEVRDIILLIASPSDFSFPSGHTASSFAAATVIFLGDKRLGAASFAIAALIAFSRMYLYVHYPTDILAGIVLGIFIGTAAVLIIRHFSKCKALIDK